MLRCFFSFTKSGVEVNNKWRAICCGICVFLLLECFMAWDSRDSSYGSLYGEATVSSFSSDN